MFVAVDGEGITRDGTHLYTLLGSSLPGRFIENYTSGLSMMECLDYLLSIKEKGCTYVGFSFNYDVNMILKRKFLSEEAFTRLQDSHQISLKRADGYTYRIVHAPKKFVRISLGIEVWKNGKCKWLQAVNKRGDPQTITIWDVWGFFQSSFVKSLLEWNICTTEDLNTMEQMKNARNNFDSIDKKQIRDYNFEECTRLVELMNKVESKLIQLGVKLKSWHGAGAVASAIYAKYKCKPFFPKSEHPMIMDSYFGGRIQAMQLGHYKGVFNYDIRSAYPYAMSELPLFDNVEPVEVTEIGPYDLVSISWNLPPTVKIVPFAYRCADKSINFYRSGSGTYHAVEVLAAMQHYSQYITIHKIMRMSYDDSVKPFEFICELYKYRAELRAINDEAQIAIKLALNSLYGKCAQRKGFGVDRKTGKPMPPTYRSYMVAGLITARCRSMLFNAAMQQPDSILMFATDGITSHVPLDLPLGEQLGLWEEKYFDEFRLYQPGMYWYRQGDKIKAKTRSLHPSCVDWDYVKTQWELYGTSANLEFTHTDFISYGIAGHKLPHAEWVERTKTLSLKPTKGIVEIHDDIVKLLPVVCPFSLPSGAFPCE